MPSLMKLLGRPKKAKHSEKLSSPSTVSSSPTPSTLGPPSTLAPSPAPPVLENGEKVADAAPAAVMEQNGLVEKDSPTTVVAPTEEPAAGVTSPKVEKKSRTRVHERTLRILDPLIDAFGIAKSGAEAANDISGPLKAAFGMTERLLMIIRGVVANDQAWEELARILEDHKGILDRNTDVVEKNKQVSRLTPLEDDFEKAMMDYAKVLETIEKKVEGGRERFKKGNAKSYFMQLGVKSQTEHIQRLTADLDRSWNFLQGRLSMSIMRTTRRVEDYVAHIRIAQMLQVADARGAFVGKLLPGTREEILDKLSSWAKGESEKQILWLCDGPGTGKSTIAAHLAKEWRDEGRLAGSFFFSQDDEHTRDLGRFCATVAKQIIEAYPTGERYLLSLQRDPSFLSFFDKFDILCKGLLEYLSKKRESSDKDKEDSATTPKSPALYPATPLIIIIDSLDQCDLYDQTRLLDALLHHLPTIASVKVLLTSTPLHDTRHEIHESNKVLKSEIIRHGSATSQRDIEVYVRKHLDGNLTSHQQDQVITSANGVFQLAAVACTFLEKSIHPAATLNQLVKRDSTFNNLYATILDGIKEEQFNVEEAINAIRTVLQAVVLAYRPVTVATHHGFLPKMDGLILNYVERIIGFLRGIVKIGGEKSDGLVYILHPTFRNYLLNLPPSETFNIAAPAGHAFMASGCLELLGQLKYDLCGVVRDRDVPLPVSDPLELPEQVLKRFGTDNSTPLRYAVVFWARHAAEGLVDEELRTKLVPFFEKQLLHWIEWAAAIRELPECIVGLEHLLKHLEPHVSLNAQKDELALRWCEDALRFLRGQKDIIGQSSMQVYYSAFAFHSRNSLVSAHYQPSISHTLPDITGHLHPIQSSRVAAIALSRNGAIIASTGGASINLWDGDNRDSIGALQTTHESSITFMSFSTDAKLLATCSIDGVILLWQLDFARLSNSKSVMLRRSGPCVDEFSFTDDNSSIICLHEDESVDIWDVAQKQCVTSYTLPELESAVEEPDVPRDPLSSTVVPSAPACYIALSNDRYTVALCRGSQLRVFHMDQKMAVEFLTIRHGVPAQPVFSRTLSTHTQSSTGKGGYLYWGSWILKMSDYQHDHHRYISKASTAEVQVSSELDSAGPSYRPASLIYASEVPTRINSYHLDDDAGVLLLPGDMEVSCWATAGTKIAVGTDDGRVMLVDFVDSRILGKGGEDLREGTSGSDDGFGFETASDGTDETGDDDALSADFMSAIEGAPSRRGSAVPA